jgi:ribosomal-protein-alanine N-acetyltransferase
MNEDKNKLVFLEGPQVTLRPLLEEDFTMEYLKWLNDPEVNEYSQRRPFPIGLDSMKSYNDYYVKHPKQGFVLAIIVKSDQTHIGNIALVNLQPIHRCVEIAILIGNKNYWNGGYGAESIYLLTKHAFRNMNLHKVFAGTFNPAFARSVERIGWQKEGEFRDRIWSNGKYHNQVWMSILDREFEIIDKYETASPPSATRDKNIGK